MGLTGDQGRLVADSYRLIKRAPCGYSELFYHRLLESHPFARALFPDDMAHQIVIFERTIDTLVANIDTLAVLHPTLAALARQHVGYGVQAYQYAAVGTVLIDTFAELLGSRFTSDTRAAWEAVYAATAGVMVEAAYPDA